MAFHYKNLLLEKELNYPEFEKQYELVKNVAIQKLYNYGTEKTGAYKNSLEKLDIAKRTLLSPKIRLRDNRNITFNRIEKLLVITNIVFNDNKLFLDTLINKCNIQIEKCIELKEALNDLDKSAKDFLDSTISALVNHYIPTWNIVTKYYGINKNEDIILAKLLEIMYLYPELLEKQNRKTI